MKVYKKCMILALALWSFDLQAQEVCNNILSYASRDTKSSSSQQDIAISIYDNYCQGETAKKQNNFNVGVEAVVKQVPVSFNLGSGSSEEKLSKFCKDFSGTQNSVQRSAIQQSTVVREALTAFNDCIAAASRGVYFYPQILRTAFAIDVRRGTENVSITGVRYNSDLLQCKVPFSDKSSVSQVADENTRWILQPGSYTIDCQRNSKEGPNGITEYPAVDIRILTDRGSLVLPISADATMPRVWATEIATQVAEISSRLDTTSAAMQNLSERLDISKAQIARVASGEKSIGASNVGDRGEIRTVVSLTRKYKKPPQVVITTEPVNGVDFVTAITTHVNSTNFGVWAWRTNGGNGHFISPVTLKWIEIGDPE